MSTKIKLPQLMGTAAIFAACLSVSSHVAANPAIGYSIAPGSSVTVGTESQTRTYGDISFGPSIALGSGVTAGIEQPTPRLSEEDSQPEVIFHHPTGLKSMGTHPNPMGGTPLRKRVSCGLNVCLDIQKRIAF